MKSKVFYEYRNPAIAYSRLMCPQPALSHENYPFYTHGGGDSRWTGSEEMEKKWFPLGRQPDVSFGTPKR